VNTQYGSKPNSLTGNDDCGQMSAWYLFTCLGFYPVCPAGDDYVLGAPQVPRAEMQLSNGKRFVVVAENLSEKNLYVQSARLNGKEWNSVYLPYSELKKGGELTFTMGPTPSRTWGVAHLGVN
jgi:putative alpha-1,2-mannosidase